MLILLIRAGNWKRTFAKFEISHNHEIHKDHMAWEALKIYVIPNCLSLMIFVLAFSVIVKTWSLVSSSW